MRRITALAAALAATASLAAAAPAGAQDPCDSDSLCRSIDTAIQTFRDQDDGPGEELPWEAAREELREASALRCSVRPPRRLGCL